MAKGKGKSKVDKKQPKAKKQSGSCLGCICTTLFWFVAIVVLLVALVVGFIISVQPGVPQETFDAIFPNKPDEVFFDVPSSYYQTINGLQVLTAGDEENELMIFLHGFPETALTSWHKQIPYFVNKGYFVLAPDQRGYNQSIKPDDVNSYTLDLLSKDIVGLIDHYKRQQAIIVSHDWGAAVGWYLSKVHSDRVSKVVTINVPHPEVMQQKLRSSWTQLKNSWYIFMFQIPWWPEYQLASNNFNWLAGALTMSPPGTYSKQTVDRYRQAWGEPNTIKSMIAWYRAAIRNIATPSPLIVDPTIEVPVMLIWGDQDRALDASMAKPSIDHCVNGRLEMVAGASHWVNHEAFDKVNKLIDDFVSDSN